MRRRPPPLPVPVVVPHPPRPVGRARRRLLLGLRGVHDDPVLLGVDLRRGAGRRRCLGGVRRLHDDVPIQSRRGKQVGLPTFHAMRDPGVRCAGIVVDDLLPLRRRWRW